MQMTEIRKQSLSKVQNISDSIISLAKQAEDILGYSVLQKHTGVVTTSELTPLQTALKDLEIDVMLPGDVLTYQKERQIEQTNLNLVEWLKTYLALDKLGRHERFDGPAWVEEKIKEYHQPVPEFVLAKAVQIKQRIPECEIYVESLSDHPDPFLIVAIPDGRAYYPVKERYYVEVWAEPKFEGKLASSSGIEADNDLPF